MKQLKSHLASTSNSSAFHTQNVTMDGILFSAKAAIIFIISLLKLATKLWHFFAVGINRALKIRIFNVDVRWYYNEMFL
jgi:hypothetical protein